MKSMMCATLLVVAISAFGQESQKPDTVSASFPSGNYMGKLTEIGGRNRSTEIRISMSGNEGTIEVASPNAPCNRRLPLRVVKVDNGTYRLESSGSIVGCERYMDVTVVNGLIDGTYTGVDNYKFKLTAQKQDK